MSKKNYKNNKYLSILHIYLHDVKYRQKEKVLKEFDTFGENEYCTLI